MSSSAVTAKPTDNNIVAFAPRLRSWLLTLSRVVLPPDERPALTALLQRATEMRARLRSERDDARTRHALNLRPACPVRVGAAKIIESIFEQVSWD